MKIPYITDIQRFSTKDGAGIRTTVFFKGCNLRCKWCHNPETIEFKPEILFYQNNCTGCAECVNICRKACYTLNIDGRTDYDRSRCVVCFKCARGCPSGAIRRSGLKYAVPGLVKLLARDKVFFDHGGGGVTFSGGEPSLFPEYIHDCIDKLYALGINVSIETNGCFDPGFLSPVLKNCRLLFDIKDTNADRLIENTGGEWSRITENLQLADYLGIKTTVRLLIIKGINDNDEHVATAANLIKSLNYCSGAELLPFHAHLDSKYSALGLKFTMTSKFTPGKKEMAALQRVMEKKGVCAEVIL